MGAISPQTSPLPSIYESYPPPTQHPVVPSKRAAVGRTSVLRTRLCHCLAPARKNQVQPNSGCRQRGDFTTHQATALRPSLLPAPLLRSRCFTETSRRRTCVSATGMFLSVPSTCKQEPDSTHLGVLTRGQVKLILSPKQRAKPAASRTRTCTNAEVCIASGECPSRF
jgi:hypothetical protein